MGLRDLLILGIIFGSLPFILYRPWLGILIWYWIGLMNPHRLTWGIAATFPVAQVVGLAALFGLVIAKDRKTIPLTRETMLLAWFAIHITITSYFAWHPTAWDQWDRVMKILLMTFVTPMLIYGRQRITWLVIVIVLSIGFYSFKAGIFSIRTGGVHHVVGPVGTFIQGNTNLGIAMIMVLPFMLVLARALKEKRLGIPLLEPWSTPLSYFFYATFWLTIVSIVFTYSRGAWVSLAVVAPLIFLKMRHKPLLVIGALLLSGSIIAFIPDQLINRAQTIQTYEEDHSSMQRLQAWGVNWNMAMERPLVGTGFNNAGIPHELWLSYANWVEPWANTPRAAHSIFFQVIGHHGFLGAAIYFTMLLCVAMTLIRIYRQANSHPSTLWMRDIAWGLLVGLVGFFTAGAFLDKAYFTLIYVFLALAVIMRRELEESATHVTDQSPCENDARSARSSSLAYPNFIATRRQRR